VPTKSGTFEVVYKSSPFTFHSPVSPGSPVLYPDAKVRYAMLFDPAEGNFLHDNGARRAYGPGTNGPGVPGGPSSGTHGCVNVPLAVMAQLYEWTPPAPRDRRAVALACYPHKLEPRSGGLSRVEEGGRRRRVGLPTAVPRLRRKATASSTLGTASSP